MLFGVITGGHDRRAGVAGKTPGVLGTRACAHTLGEGCRRAVLRYYTDGIRRLHALLTRYDVSLSSCVSFRCFHSSYVFVRMLCFLFFCHFLFSPFFYGNNCQLFMAINMKIFIYYFVWQSRVDKECHILFFS